MGRWQRLQAADGGACGRTPDTPPSVLRTATSPSELWEEFGAIDQDDNFVQLLPAVRKPLEEIASKKRAMYRRRYAWLDELTLNCQQALNRAPD